MSNFPAINFERSEFACKCGCGFDVVDAELLVVLRDLRRYFDKKVHINSGCRCAEHNKKVGGSPRSQHLLGKAADIVVDDVNSSDVYIYLDRKNGSRYGIGNYPTFTHIDVRSKKARF